MSSPAWRRFTVRRPADLLALVPYLVGYHPHDRLLAVGAHDAQPIFIASGELPAPGTPQHETRAFLEYLAGILARQHATAVVVIGYGPADQVTPVIAGVGEVFAAHRIRVHDALRVTNDRYFSYLCGDPDCCPPYGVPFDPTTNVMAAEATLAGLVALQDRTALAAQVAAVDGAARAAMRLATQRAQTRLAGLITAADDAATATAAASIQQGRVTDPEDRLRRAGHHAVQQALHRYEHGATLSDDEAANLTLLLTLLPVRDEAWQHTDSRDEHIAMWTDLTRRARQDLVSAPASLLAFASWRRGNGALANVALDRALAADPSYRLALLLAQVLSHGVPPSVLHGWPANPDDAAIPGRGTGT